MYHYVRDLPRTRYPQIKARLTKDFDGQLDYIQQHYNVCGFDQLVSAVNGEGELPHNPCMLVFHDGFLDHYITVFPRLVERGLTGGFYSPSKAIMGNEILDVHKIQHILAATLDHDKLVSEIFQMIHPFRSDFDIPDDAELFKLHAKPSRYDPPEVGFIKVALQMGLPEQVRTEIVRQLFGCHVDENEATFSRELYMDVSQLRCMAQQGMTIGGHGYQHNWIGSLDKEGQEREVGGSVDLLTKVYGEQPRDWTMAYPSNSFNDLTVDLLKRAGCAVGMGGQGMAADLSDPLRFPQLDTNDIPLSGDAEISEWTLKARQSQLNIGTMSGSYRRSENRS